MTQQRQATALTLRDAHRISDRVLSDTPRLKDVRDVALMMVGKDLLARACELVALSVDVIHFEKDGTAHVALHRRKTSNEPQDCLLGPNATTQLRRWLADAAITSGAVFQSITKGGGVTGKALSARDVGRILKGLAARAKLGIAGISGHSLRRPGEIRFNQAWWQTGL